MSKSEGTLPAQRWAPEPTGEGGSQLLAAAVPGRGPHPERAAQHPALPADSGELPPDLLEAQHPDRAHRGWRGRRWLSAEVLHFFWKESLRTVRHLMHYLGSDYQAQEHRSGDQAHQITSYNFWKYWCTVYLVAHNYFCCYTVCSRPCLFTEFTWDEGGLRGYWFCQTFTKILKHACHNGCMMWISLHCIFCVLQD